MAERPITVSLKHITSSDTDGYGVSGLADTPGISASELKAKFDNLGKVAIPNAVNEMVDETEVYLNDIYQRSQGHDNSISALQSSVITDEGKITSLENRATTSETNITNLQSGKVDKVAGKGLSTNDYTNAEKTKVSKAATEVDISSTRYNINTEASTNGKVVIDFTQIDNDIQEANTKALRAKNIADSAYNTAKGLEGEINIAKTTSASALEKANEANDLATSTWNTSKIVTKIAIEVRDKTDKLEEKVDELDEKVESNYLNAPIPQTTLPLTKKTLSGTLKDVALFGNCVQNGTPTPSAPIPIEYAKEDDKITTFRFANFDYYEMLNSYQQSYLSENESLWKNENAFVFVNPYDSDLHIATVSICYKSGSNWYTRLIKASSVDVDSNRGASLPTWLSNLWNNGSYTNASGTVFKTIYNPNIEGGYLHAEISIPCDLLGLPNAQDELSGGKVTRRVGKCAIPSNIDWALSNGCFQTASAFPSNLGSKQEALCDMLKLEYYASAITSNLDNGCFGWNNEGKLTVRVDGIATVEAFKSWLNSATPMLIYVLATSTTSTTLPLEEIPTYAEQTTINAYYIELSGKYPTDALNVIEKSALDVYSMEETVVGDFIGKPLYRCVVETSVMTIASGWSTRASFLDSLTIDECIRCRALANTSELRASVEVGLYITSSGLCYLHSPFASGYNNISKFVLEYTKVDDSASQISLLSEEEG